jgi:hypothetical protein
MNDENLTKAKYGEWLASLFGACGIAMGLGIYFANYLIVLAPWLILAGIALHGWGMYKIREHNK